MKFQNDPEGMRLPVKLDTTTNGEFAPIPLEAIHRHANRLALEEATARSRRLGALTNASAIQEPARSGSSPITGRISSLYVPRRMLILCSRPCVVDKGER